MFSKNLFICLITLVLSNENFPGPSEYFNEMIVIEQPDLLILYWKYDQTDITFEIHTRTVGWIQFGLSHSGMLQYSDVIVAWLNEDGTGHFSDRHIIDKHPVVDKIQNWHPILFEKRKNNFTLLKFTRKLIICDSSPQEEIDIDIFTSMNHIIYALGGKFINSEEKDIDLNQSIKGSIALDLIESNENLNLFECMNPIYTEIEPKPTGFYMNSLEIVPNLYKLYWNSTETKFIAEIHVKNNQWFCFGFRLVILVISF